MAIKVSIVGASGYTGGELLRLLLFHPEVEIVAATSERLAGKPVKSEHPNLRNVTDLKFTSIADLPHADVMFLCLPHGTAMHKIGEFLDKADKIIDLSADFRLRTSADYEKWYGEPHPREDLLDKFVYGIPELHREEIKNAKYVAACGCNATTTILTLYPLFKAGVAESEFHVDAKCGASQGGASPNPGSHYPERFQCLRSYQPTGHRHIAEMIQELGQAAGSDLVVNFSATSVTLVRGILVTAHIKLKRKMTDLDIWKIYREAYGNERFIRLVKDKQGIFRYPEPKLLAGTNFCDIGFELDEDGERLVMIGAIDNMMKGASGQAVQCMNLMCGFKEDTALEFPGLHPV